MRLALGNGRVCDARELCFLLEFVNCACTNVAHADLYDGRGDLWRVLEQYGVQYYDAPTFWLAGSSEYDLQARRYVATAFTNEEKPIVFDGPMKAQDFTTDALRRAGN